MNQNRPRRRASAALRNAQIVAARIRDAADQLESAFAELDGAKHDAETSRIFVDPYDGLELGREPFQMVAELRATADAILEDADAARIRRGQVAQ